MFRARTRGARAAPTVDWLPVRERLGVRLPSDFERLVDEFGPFAVGWEDTPDLIKVDAPGDPRDAWNLEKQMEYYAEVVDSLRDFEREHDPDNVEQNFPYRVFPEAGGLLPFAQQMDGDTFCWKTVGDCDGWTIVVLRRQFAYDESPWYEFDGGLADWLLGRLTGTVTGPPLYDDEDLETITVRLA
jgi:hypothetical protein